MAGSVPSLLISKRVRIQLLKCIYYKQSLSYLVADFGVDLVVDEVRALTLAGCVRKLGKSYAVTAVGISLLVKLNGGKMPPMIELQDTLKMEHDEGREYIVGSSLIASLSRDS